MKFSKRGVIAIILILALTLLTGCVGALNGPSGTITISVNLPDLVASGFPVGSKYAKLSATAVRAGNTATTASVTISDDKPAGSEECLDIAAGSGWTCTVVLEVTVPTYDSTVTNPGFKGSATVSGTDILHVALSPLPSPMLLVGIKWMDSPHFRDDGVAVISNGEYEFEASMNRIWNSEHLPPGIYAMFDPQNGLPSGTWHLKANYNRYCADSFYVEEDIKVIPGVATLLFYDLSYAFRGAAQFPTYTGVPQDPTGLSVRPGLDGFPVVSWTATSEDAYYIVYRAPAEDPSLKHEPSYLFSNTDVTVKPGRSYLYWVQARSYYGHDGRMVGPIGYTHPIDGPVWTPEGSL